MLSLDQKVGFLSRQEAYGEGSAPVTALETHMSWVFLCGDRVYKFKKPIVSPFIDFSDLAARELNCKTELRLNRRLAPDVYLRVTPLVSHPDGMLSIDGEGTVEEWLLEMRRLPEKFMLDQLIKSGTHTANDLVRLAERLTAFYRRAEPISLDPLDHFRLLECQNEINREVLRHEEFDIDHQAARNLLNDLDHAFHQLRDPIEQRIKQGRYIEGHGDLRPEHICLCDPLAIFDCLEFDRRLRLIDPFDEIAFLGMECSFLGAPDIADTLYLMMEEKLDDRILPELRFLYTAFRAAMRARMSYSHLLDCVRVVPGLWEEKTTKYLALAQAALYRGGFASLSAR
ncbi:hypothetical protein [Rhizobium binae]|uniref:hypothetical protein n=1 Tax=Rhizobium binae TaxID=1138190 RepID=UPI001C83BBBE|nr:hypothetical protein [Rhizobium binae]MBX4963436.1 hypothetical protein [Rhizobium binae]